MENTRGNMYRIQPEAQVLRFLKRIPKKNREVIIEEII